MGDEPPPPPLKDQMEKRIRDSGAIILGDVDRGELLTNVDGALAELRGCYEDALAKAPDAVGQVVIKFVVDAGGEVVQSVVQSSSPSHAEAERCLAERFARMAFSPSTSGGITVITFPLVLQEPGP